MQRDLTPDEWKTILEIIEHCDEIDELINYKKLQRTKRVQELKEREAKAAYLWSDTQAKQELLARLFHDFAEKVRALEVREKKVAVRGAELASGTT